MYVRISTSSRATDTTTTHRFQSTNEYTYRLRLLIVPEPDVGNLLNSQSEVYIAYTTTIWSTLDYRKKGDAVVVCTLQ